MGQYGGLPPDAFIGSLHDDLLEGVHAAVSLARVVETCAHCRVHLHCCTFHQLSRPALYARHDLRQAEHIRHRKALLPGSADRNLLNSC